MSGAPAVLAPLTQLPDSVIRHATEAVFRQPAFNRLSLWDRLIGFLIDLLVRGFMLLRPFFAMLHRSPFLYWTVITLLAAIVVGVIARAVYLWRLRSTMGAAGTRWTTSPGGRGRDPWLVAQELAARGDFTDAAHALYAAFLEAAARQEQVRLHPSKTVGDYVRELRAKSSALFIRFRDFARSYETVIYGIGHCDEARYQRLYALVAPIVRSHG